MSLGSNYSIMQKYDLLDWQCKLQARITGFENQMSIIMKLDNDIQWSPQNGVNLNVGTDPEEIIDEQARMCQFTYWQAQNLLKWPNIDLQYLETLHKITNNDLKVSGDLTDERRHGQHSNVLT